MAMAYFRVAVFLAAFIMAASSGLYLFGIFLFGLEEGETTVREAAWILVICLITAAITEHIDRRANR